MAVIRFCCSEPSLPASASGGDADACGDLREDRLRPRAPDRAAPVDDGCGSGSRLGLHVRARRRAAREEQDESHGRCSSSSVVELWHAAPLIAL